MLFYDIRTAFQSLRRNPILSSLLIGAIAIGICVSTSFIALRHLMEKDPLPGRSRTIFNVRLDSWGLERPYDPSDPKALPRQITYRDMRGLMQSNIPTRQTGAFVTRSFIFPDPKAGRPYRDNVRLVFSDFFPMFGIPFEHGGGWDKAADAKPEQVVVIDHATNEKLFGGANSVGRKIRIDEREYKVTGVIARDWRPSVRPYDLTQGMQPPEGVFMPFNFTPILQLFTTGNVDAWKNSGNDYASFLNSETVWIQFWVELPTREKQRAYRDFVDNYVRGQKEIGRFVRPLHTEVTSLPDLMVEMKIIPQSVKSMSIVSVLFLVVCSLNLVGLLLGKFLARIPEVSVRRALGASRFQIFRQHVVECELVGVTGGVIGIALSLGVLKLIAKSLPSGQFIRLDVEMIAVAIVLSLIAGLLAGIYPSWRVSTVAPAMQLKIQ